MVWSMCMVAAPEPVKLASPGLTGFKVEADAAHYYSDYLAQRLVAEGLVVTTATQMAAMIGLERQRQLLGCETADSSCLAELGAALGVDGIITGTLGRFGNEVQIDVQVVSASDGRTLTAFSERVASESAVLDALSRAAKQMAPVLTEKLDRTPLKPSGGGSVRPFALIPAIGAVLAAGSAAVFTGLSRAHYDRLVSGDLTLTQPAAFASEGSTFQSAAIGLWVGAAVLLGVAVVLFLVGGSP